METNYGHGAWVLVFALAAATGVHAAEDGESGWSVGAGAAIFSSPFKGADDVVSPIPYVSYEGEHLSLTPFGLGYRLVSTETFTISVIAAPRFQLTEPKDSPFLKGMAKRGSTLEGGISFEFNSDIGGLRLDAQSDLLDKHKGAQLALAYSRGFQMGDVGVTPRLGVTWQSAKLADYYYGVRRSEATAARPAYKVGDAFIPNVGLDLSYQLSKRTSLVALTSIEVLPKTIKRSPIVSDKTVGQAIVGVIYRF